MKPERPQEDPRAEAAFAALAEALRLTHREAPPEALMEEARRRFVAPSALFGASAHLLEAIGFNKREALLYSQVPALVRHLACAGYGSRPRLDRLQVAADYLVGRFQGLAVEHFYLLSLDAAGRLGECRLLDTGTDDSASFRLRDVLTEVVRTRAKAVVISHNHPSFSARPSQEDVACTLALLGALRPLGVVLLDHVVICGRESVSLRAHGYIREQLWRAQAPENRLLKNWLTQDGSSGS